MTQVSISDKTRDELNQLNQTQSLEAITEEALALWIRLKKQELIRQYKGKLKWEGNLDELRSSKL